MKVRTFIKLISVVILVLSYWHQSQSMEVNETTTEINGKSIEEITNECEIKRLKLAEKDKREKEIMDEFCAQLMKTNQVVDIDESALILSYKSNGSINISIKNIQTLPLQIANLDKLKTLYLFHNQLTTLPIEIGYLKNLVILNLRNNYLTSVPKIIFTLTKLNELYLHENQIESIPPEMDTLTELQILYLSKNKLESIPPSFGKLQPLKILDISNNNLKFFPSELGYIRNLKKLNLSNNSGLGLRWEHVFWPSGHGGDKSLHFFRLLCKIDIIPLKYLILGSLSSCRDKEINQIPAPKEIIALIFNYLWQLEKIPDLDQSQLLEFTP